MAYYLGIDGGGSKTTCAIGDESSQLATAIAGPSNITRVGESRARESLHQAIRDACAAAQIVPQQIQRACIGVAGAGREEVATVVRNIVAEVIGGDVEVMGDMPIALEAAFGKEPGVTLAEARKVIAQVHRGEPVTLLEGPAVAVGAAVFGAALPGGAFGAVAMIRVSPGTLDRIPIDEPVILVVADEADGKRCEEIMAKTLGR